MHLFDAYHFAWYFHIGTCFSLEEVRYSLHVTMMTLRSRDSFWSYDVWLVVSLLSMFDLEMLTLGHSPLIDDRFCEMTVYVRHILFRDYFTLRAYPFWEDAFILRYNHWHWDWTFYSWLLLSMDHRVIDTLGLVFSTYLVRLGYPLFFVTHPYILHLTPLYLDSSYQSLTSFEPTYFIILHDLIPFSWSDEIQTSLELFG